METPAFQTVYAVTSYHDGILGGVADYLGKPHIFLLHDEAKAKELPLYSLIPVPEPLLAMLVDRTFTIWDPPQEIWDLVEGIAKHPSSHKVAYGDFEPSGDIDLSSTEESDLHVRWFQEPRGDGAV